MKMKLHKRWIAVILSVVLCTTLFGGSIAFAQEDPSENFTETPNMSEGTAEDSYDEAVAEDAAAEGEPAQSPDEMAVSDPATTSSAPVQNFSAPVAAPKVSAVATIGENGYDSLKSAFENVADGQTIILQDNITKLTTDGIATLAAGKKVSLDMNGKSITVAPDFSGMPIVNNGDLTIYGNGVIDSSASANGGYGAVNNYGTLTIQDGTYRGAKDADGSVIRNTGSGAELIIEDGVFEDATCAIFNEGSVTINGGTFSGTTCSQCNSKIWSYTIRNNTADCKMVINGGTFTGVQGAVSSSVGYLEINGGTFKTLKCAQNLSHTATFYALYAAGEVGKVKCVINDGYFETEGRYTAVLIGNDNTGGDGGINEKATGIINGGTFVAPEGVPALKGAEKTGDPQINGGTFSSDVSKYVNSDVGAMVQGSDGNYVVKSYVAENNGKKYISLEEAVKEAGKGDTVKLLSNASGNGIVVPSGSELTIDFGGFTYTIDGATVGSSGTETNGFQLLKDSQITMKDGTVTSAKAKILIQNYSNLTLLNMNLDGSNMPQGGNYVLSNNCGDVALTGNTNITAAEGNVAFDVCYWAPYYAEGVQVTVNTTGMITGPIEYTSTGSAEDTEKNSGLVIENVNLNGELDVKADGASVAVSGGTFTNEIPAEYIADGSVYASITSSGDTAYYIGTAEEVAKEIEGRAEAGDTVTVRQGDIVLVLPEGVAVENKSEDNVIVNGENVAPGETITVTEEKETSLKDEATGVTLYAAEGVLPGDVRLVVRPIAEAEQDYANAKEALKEKAGKFVLYDITLINEAGETIQPDGNVLVGIPIPNGYDTGKLAVHWINDDKTTVEHGVAVQGGMSYFQTDHFSKYALIEKGTMIQTGDSDNNPTGDDETSNKGETPKTDDTADTAPYILMILVAGAAIAVTRTAAVRKRAMKSK